MFWASNDGGQTFSDKVAPTSSNDRNRPEPNIWNSSFHDKSKRIGIYDLKYSRGAPLYVVVSEYLWCLLVVIFTLIEDWDDFRGDSSIECAEQYFI